MKQPSGEAGFGVPRGGGPRPRCPNPQTARRAARALLSLAAKGPLWWHSSSELPRPRFRGESPRDLDGPRVTAPATCAAALYHGQRMALAFATPLLSPPRRQKAAKGAVSSEGGRFQDPLAGPPVRCHLGPARPGQCHRPQGTRSSTGPEPLAEPHSLGHTWPPRPKPPRSLSLAPAQPPVLSPRRPRSSPRPRVRAHSPRSSSELQHGLPKSTSAPRTAAAWPRVPWGTGAAPRRPGRPRGPSVRPPPTSTSATRPRAPAALSGRRTAPSHEPSTCKDFRIVHGLGGAERRGPGCRVTWDRRWHDRGLPCRLRGPAAHGPPALARPRLRRRSEGPLRPEEQAARGAPGGAGPGGGVSRACSGAPNAQGAAELLQSGKPRCPRSNSPRVREEPARPGLEASVGTTVTGGNATSRRANPGAHCISRGLPAAAFRLLMGFASAPKRARGAHPRVSPPPPVGLGAVGPLTATGRGDKPGSRSRVRTSRRGVDTRDTVVQGLPPTQAPGPKPATLLPAAAKPVMGQRPCHPVRLSTSDTGSSEHGALRA
uniref:translation initiation factor IF-2-like n=1 Tax=Nyctereutes procyonoides TaxID=34880 RepID=UPI002443A4FE|nr:translation initiation factor IF-2-like [Nyctereutes procyonoides]